MPPIPNKVVQSRRMNHATVPASDQNGSVLVPVVVALKTEERATLAINLFDLDRTSDVLRRMVGTSVTSTQIKPDDLDMTPAGGKPSVALGFCNELLLAAGLCDIIRSHDRKVGDYPTRCYIRRGEGWYKLRGDQDLTVVHGQQMVLNPLLFLPEAAVIRQPRARRVF